MDLLEDAATTHLDVERVDVPRSSLLNGGRQVDKGGEPNNWMEGWQVVVGGWALPNSWMEVDGRSTWADAQPHGLMDAGSGGRVIEGGGPTTIRLDGGWTST